MSRFQEVKTDHSFHGLTRMLFADVRRGGSETYYLFTREEAKKLNFIFKNVWTGRAWVSVSYYYAHENTIAFKVNSPNFCSVKRNEAIRILDSHKQSIGKLFDEDVEFTEEDKQLIKALFYMPKAA